MKTFTVVFLFAVLFMGRAVLLHYYMCQNEASPSASIINSECLEPERPCVAVDNRTSDHQLSPSKWCAQKCPEIEETGLKVVHCEDNSCKRKGSGHRRTSCTALIVVTLAVVTVNLAVIMVTLASFYVLQVDP